MLSPTEYANMWALQIENEILRNKLEELKLAQDEVISFQIQYLDPDHGKV